MRLLHYIIMYCTTVVDKGRDKGCENPDISGRPQQDEPLAGLIRTLATLAPPEMNLNDLCGLNKMKWFK